MAFLTSPYFQSEYDMFTVYMGTGSCKYQIGVILPLLLLDEDDEENIVDIKPHYRRHANLAIRKLIKYIIKNKLLPPEETTSRLTSSFKYPDTSLLLYKSADTGNDIGYLLPSLYDNGFYLLTTPCCENQRNLYESAYMQSIVEEKKCIKNRNIYLHIIKDYLQHKHFYHTLFTEILPFSINPFYRFVCLYQAIEILSGYAYYEKYDLALKSFEKGEISKNDLREKLVQICNEKNLINIIYIGVNWRDSKLLNDKIASLLAKASIDKEGNGNLCHNIYLLRNKIVHEMWWFTKYTTELREIVEYLEKDIFNLLVESKVKRE